MALLTERVTVTLPADVKAHLRQRAKLKGISLSALMREITGEPMLRHAPAQLKQPDTAEP